MVAYSHLMTQEAFNYVRLESPDQIEIGDSVYRVVRWGDGPNCVKHVEMRVLDKMRRAVVVAKEGGPKGASTTKVRFDELVIRAPEQPAAAAAVVKRLPIPKASVRRDEPFAMAVIDVEFEPVAKTSSMTTYIELTESLLQEMRGELDGIDGAKDAVAKELADLELGHRQRLEALAEQVRKEKHSHEKSRLVVQASIDALEQKRAPLSAEISRIETALSTVRGA